MTPAFQYQGSQRRDIASGVPTFVLWLLIQALILAAAGADLQLTAQGGHFARPLAPRMMLIAQLLFSAATFPELLGSWRLALLVAAVAFPFTQFAGHLAGEPAAQALLRFLALFLWLGGLFLWTVVLSTRNKAVLATSAMVLWIIGTPLLWYLGAEFSPILWVQDMLIKISPVLLAAQEQQHGLLVLLGMHVAIAGLAVCLVCRGRLGWHGLAKRGHAERGE